MKPFAVDHVALDSVKVIEDSKCCLKVAAVITQVGVYHYPDGRALKCKMELLKAANAIRYAGAKITILDHPASMIVQTQDDIKGGVERPFFDRNKVRAILNFDKARCPTDYLQRVREGKLTDVSIGFYYKADWTPGVWKDPLTGQTEPYDYIMRDIVIDHVASGVPRGKCAFPSCGIGVDALAADKVVKRGNKWCVIHCHGPKAGQPIKCYTGPDAKAKAEAMHRGMQARKHQAALRLYTEIMKLSAEAYEQTFKGVAQDERPPKDWWNKCFAKAQSFASDPAKFCGWLFHHGHEDPKWSKIKSSFGSSSQGGINKMNETHAEEQATFEACVKQRMEENDQLTREEAEALCKPATLPEDEPTPPGGTLTDAEQSPYQKCIAEKVEGGMSMTEAAAKCKEEGVTKTDQDAAFENCVTRKMEKGTSREDAEKECRGEHPVAEEDQEEEPTPLERCIASRTESEGETEDAAREWCEAELAGEHESAGDLIERSEFLLKQKAQRDAARYIEKRKTP